MFASNTIQFTLYSKAIEELLVHEIYFTILFFILNKSISKNSAIFLAIVLVAGTISMIIPSSFAQPYDSEDPYAKDRKKSADVNIQKIDCDNINSNFNGIDSSIGTDNPFNTGGEETTESIQSNEDSTNTFGNGWEKRKDNGDFEIYCINNNKNEVVQMPGQTLPINIYQVVDEARTSASGGTATSTAICDEGDVALSGSYLLIRPPDTEIVIDGVLSTPDKWIASATAVAGKSITIQSIAQCLDNPPLRP